MPSKSRLLKDVQVENARIAFRNFSGNEGKFNRAGNRNFNVLLPEDAAKAMEADGWNIRWLKPKEEGDAPQATVQVTLSFENYPPKVVLIAGKGKTELDDTSVNILDWADIINVDLVIRPYQWVIAEGTKNEKTGVKAYVKYMYVTIKVDPFESKYEDVPDSAVNSLPQDDNSTY